MSEIDECSTTVANRGFTGRHSQTSLEETLNRFGTDTTRRKALALRLERIYQLASQTGQVARFIVFGSFITSKPEPNDVDVFLLMEDTLMLVKSVEKPGFFLSVPALSPIWRQYFLDKAFGCSRR